MFRQQLVATSIVTATFGVLVLAQSREAMERDYQRGVIYLVTAAGRAHAEPDATSKVVGSVEPFTGLLVYNASEGWIQIGLPLSDTFERGWIRGSSDNLVAGNQLTIPLRLAKMNGKAWPPAVRLDILRGKPRVGFTKEQLLIAVGDPLRRLSEETASGTTEVWSYATATYTVKADRVTKITRVE